MEDDTSVRTGYIDCGKWHLYIGAAPSIHFEAGTKKRRVIFIVTVVRCVIISKAKLLGFFVDNVWSQIRNNGIDV